MQNYKKIIVAFLIYVLSLLLITFSLQGKDLFQVLMILLSSIVYLLYMLNED